MVEPSGDAKGSPFVTSLYGISSDETVKHCQILLSEDTARNFAADRDDV